MVSTYTIFGRQVGSHVLSIVTLGAVGIGAYLSTAGGKKASEPPINAKNKEEESFVKDFIKKAETDDKAKR